MWGKNSNQNDAPAAQGFILIRVPRLLASPHLRHLGEVFGVTLFTSLDHEPVEAGFRLR